MNHSLADLRWTSAEWPDVTRDQLYAFTKLRIAVFVVEQNCPYPEFDDKDQKSLHLWAQDQKGDVQAYLRIVQPGVSYDEISIGRVVTSQAYRGLGLGKELMHIAMTWINENYGNVPVRISAQCYLVKFYRDFDFISVGEEYLEDGIPHIEMLYNP